MVNQSPDSQATEGQNRIPHNEETGNQDKKSRHRSVYLFPAYGFGTALTIAQRVEDGGGGSLSEETLAINMGLSVKSSGFRLKALAARQFQLLTKQADVLTTTPTAKAILKPTSSLDAMNGYRQAFMAVPLFRAVAERFKGQPLPQGQTMRNVLEREFQVEHGRVQQAERILLDSARDAQVLTANGDKTYLSITGQPPAVQGAIVQSLPTPPIFEGEWSEQPQPEPQGPYRSTDGNHNVLTFSLDEIGQLDDGDFDAVWDAMGKLVKARRKSQQSQPSVMDYPQVAENDSDEEEEPA